MRLLNKFADANSIPWLHRLILFSFALSVAFGSYSIGDLQLSGIGWLLPLIGSVVAIAATRKRISFPMRFWFVWITIVTLSMLASDAPNAAHRTVIMLTPLVVAVAASCIPLTEHQVFALLRGFKLILIILIAAVLIRTTEGLLLASRDVYEFPTEAIATVFLFSVFLGLFFGGHRSIIWFAAASALVPLMTVNRGSVIASLYVLALGFFPVKLRLRVGILVASVALGIFIFNLETIQSKMFFSGHGTLVDLVPGNPDLRTSGRQVIWEHLLELSMDAPALGHGANANEQVVDELTSGVKHPHNDWLRIIFDYGFVGMIAFLLAVVLQLVDLKRIMKRTTEIDSTLISICLTALVAFCLLMITDNILLYGAFYGNALFMIIGIIYARNRTQPTHQRVSSLTQLREPTSHER